MNMMFIVYNWVSYMKKILSILISFIIVALSLSNGAFALSSAMETKKLYDFAEDLMEMSREYDETNPQVNATVSLNKRRNATNGEQDKYANLGSSAFVTKRLVVKSEKRYIDKRGAVDCVSGYRDLFILQYETMEAAQEAYDFYLTCDYVIYVEPDYVVQMQSYYNIEEFVADSEEAISDIDIDDEEISDLVDDLKDLIEENIGSDDDDDDVDSDMSYDSHDEALSWVSEKIGFEDIKEELEGKVKDDYIQVAVLDTGVDTDHEFLEGRLIGSNVNFSNTGAENSVEDDFGHGTHVAGIIADNTLSNVYIKPYKVLNCYGNGTESLIAIAVDLAVADGADIINMSLKSNGVFQTMIDSVNNAVAQGVNVVVAAGNDHKDLSKEYVTPACVPSAITVSATDENDKLAEYSNYNGTIDIAAPGNDIKSSYLNNGYVKLSGTSMAAPQVVAGLAIVRTLFPEKTAAEAEEMIKEYAAFLPESIDENKFGAGLLCLKYILGEKPRTTAPVFSRESGTFSNSFTLTITCPEPLAKIYYVISDTDDLFEVKLYDSALTISLDTTIYAIAIVDGKDFSSIVKAEYIRSNDSEEDLYDINSSGYITGYWGAETDLIIPNKIDGKTVKGVGMNAFKDNATIRSVALPSTATRINVSAFEGCTALESVTGTGLTQVDMTAFKDSSISEFSFDKVKTIGVSAFENCKNLKDVSLPKATDIKTYAFKNANGLTTYISEELTSLGSSAFEGSSIEEVDLPNIKSLTSYTFQNCKNLKSAKFTAVSSVGTYTFSGCESLTEIEIPVAESIGAGAFKGAAFEEIYCYKVKTLGNFAFSDNNNLAFVTLPKVTSIGTYSFQNCPELQVVNMPELKELTNDSFKDCPKLLQLWLPSVETIKKNALDSSSLQYIQFDKVKTINSLPTTLKGLVAPSTLTSISGTIPENNFVVYGYAGTYAEQFANDNSKTFSTLPTIIYNLKDRVDPDDVFIMVYALGFNCKYQWYKNDVISNVGGTPIEGATHYYYSPSDSDNATVYYCEITSSDGINSNTIVTKPIKNSYVVEPADLSRYNETVEEANTLDRTKYTEEELQVLDTLLSIDISDFTADRQEEIDSLIESIKKEFLYLTTPTLLGDLNDDGSVTAIDARIALRYAASLITLSGRLVLTGDMNGDGDITAVDVRTILLKAAE